MTDVVWRLTSEQVDRLLAFFSESAEAGVFDYDDGGVLLDIVTEFEMLVAQRDRYQAMLQPTLVASTADTEQPYSPAGVCPRPKTLWEGGE